ncbi:hypothetical protein LguiB_011008 [Lonicera macranthoides]
MANTVIPANWTPGNTYWATDLLIMSNFKPLTLCNIRPRHLNSTIDGGQNFSPAIATWYGTPTGAGSGKRECVIKCTGNPACSGWPVSVTITDECPGCTDAPFHFDLSGTAFGAMAKRGQADSLRGAGKVNIGYERSLCNYHGTKLAFRIDGGSNPNYLAFVIEYENGDGDLASVVLRVGTKWIPMQPSWGAKWKVNLGSWAKAPFSLQLTTIVSKKTLVANNTIPAN